MKTAYDIMTPNPKFIQSGDELLNVVDLFVNNAFHSAPVVTPMGEVLGLISEVSLMRASLRHYMAPDRHEKVYAHRDLLEEAVFANEHTNIEDVIKLLLKSPTRRVLIRNGQGTLVGIVSPKDILRVVTGTSSAIRDLAKEMEMLKVRSAKLEARLNELGTEKERYEKIFEESPYMIHGVNERGVLVLANKKIHDRLGYAQGELIGKTLAHIYPQSVLPLAMQGLQEVIEKGSHKLTYSSLVTSTGEKVRVDIASSSMRDAKGVFVSTISVSREIDSENLLRALHGALGDGQGPFDPA